MLETLQKKKSTSILLALLEDSRHVRELQSEVGGSASTIGSRIREMKEKGLVSEETEKNWPYKKIIKLTNRGRDVAEVLSGLSGFARKRKITLMSFKERMKWPLVLVHRLKEVDGATRMQKLLFLLKRKFGVEVPYNFSPYKYGPFCKNLARDMACLVTAGLTDNTEESYILTSEGEEMAEEIFENLSKKVREAIGSLEKFNKMELRRLLNLVYTQFPEESKGSREIPNR
ncbi:hypothetical protein AKJ48_04335 [candidate division MSBL1 archaeon SCGC-AAA261O19]|uniref:HTH hxlR-type domain-containing protein n=1 Tax=candidate division MSBL1 archaeon SCGC-AAA261O19 TaxID=1698277 RepID=A0A133V991_9EURY|nr:hypothetical protein AKJ48_04335 [candidate division MSBL1 archaeon SCGC-AAA261O19]